MTLPQNDNPPVLVSIDRSAMTVTLNRPKAINSLNLEMIRHLQAAMDRAGSDDAIKLVVLAGAGERGFCAGADVKAAVSAVTENRKADAMAFFTEEYALDQCIHNFSKPVVAIAAGITMGGGLGLTAGADLVIATETTRMAMPETRIGFIPDVGATGWLFGKCPQGYAEYLGLTGREMEGAQTVCVGLAHLLVVEKDLPGTIEALSAIAPDLDPSKEAALAQIRKGLASLSEPVARDPGPAFDRWVADTFAGTKTVTGLITALSNSTEYRAECDAALQELAERSPTATVLTLKLLRQNQGSVLADVFAAETKACDFIISHPDYAEGVRARLIDKDNQPAWQPDSIDEVGELDVDIRP